MNLKKKKKKSKDVGGNSRTALPSHSTSETTTMTSLQNITSYSRCTVWVKYDIGPKKKKRFIAVYTSCPQATIKT